MTEQRKGYIQQYKAKRELTCYPPEKYAGLVRSYAEQNEITESSVISHAIKCFFDNMPAIERLKLNC